MKLLLLLVLLSPSLARDLDPQPRKQNVVTMFLEEILNKFFEKLSTEGLSIPLLNLDTVGNFSDVKTTASGLTKDLNGIKTHGFQMHVKASKAATSGKYHLVNLEVPGLFPVSGKGDFRVEMEEFEVKVSLEATRNFAKEKFDFNLAEFSAKMSSSKVKFDNLMDDPHVADFLNELLSNLLPDLALAIAEMVRTDKTFTPTLIDVYGNGIYDCLKKVGKEAKLKCIKDLFNPSYFLTTTARILARETSHSGSGVSFGGLLRAFQKPEQIP